MKITDNTKNLTFIALMTAFICILGPLSIPIGPVPVSLQNFAIYLVLYIVGMKRGTVAFLLYMLLGLMGLPVFAGFTGGLQKIAGPTGGYLVGFIGMAVLAGWVVDHYSQKRIRCVAGMFLATCIPYLLGTLWLAHSTGIGFAAAFAAGVVPFVPVDLAKMAVAAVVGPQLRERLAKAGIVADAKKA
jgi:biotin transport system substrate-specific component